MKISITSRVEVISPSQAQAYLDAFNTMNRALNQGTVRRYAEDMKSGRWDFNGATIVFSDSGVLLDGQHRLAACVESGIPLRVLVVSGVSAGSFRTMDTGSVRSFNSTLGIDGEKHSRILAGASKLAFNYENGGVPCTGAPTTSQKYAFLEENPDLRAAAAFADEMCPRRGSLVSKPQMAFCYWVLNRVDSNAALDFCSQVATGEGVPPSSPVSMLRQRLLANKTERTKLRAAQILYLMFRAWRATIQNDRISKLVLPKAKRFRAEHYSVAA